MPSVAQVSLPNPDSTPSLGTIKRKRDHFYSAPGNYAENGRERDVHMRFATSPTSSLTHDSLYANILLAPSPIYHERVLLKPRKSKPLRSHDAKRQRVALEDLPQGHSVPSNIHQDDTSTDVNDVEKDSSKQNLTKADLSACHICYRKPKVKSDLDGYVDCEGCGGRTCWICVRECLGDADEGAMGLGFGMEDGIAVAMEGKEWSDDNCGNGEVKRSRWENSFGDWMHREVVCSRCCVERGVDGEVKCLGCLRAEEG